MKLQNISLLCYRAHLSLSNEGFNASLRQLPNDGEACV